jgi:hypothetical protein
MWRGGARNARDGSSGVAITSDTAQDSLVIAGRLDPSARPDGPGAAR